MGLQRLLQNVSIFKGDYDHNGDYMTMSRLLLESIGFSFVAFDNLFKCNFDNEYIL